MNVLLQRIIDSLSVQQVCWSCAVIAFGGISYGAVTYASNATVKTLAVDIAQIRVDMLESRAFDLRVKQCAALKSGDPAGVYRQRLQELLLQYYQRTGTTYPIPECAEL